MNLNLSKVRKIAYAGVLIGLNVILNRLVGLAQAGPLFSFARISPGISIVIFASLILGPFFGALVGVAGDALGWVILGQWTGTFNFFLSIFYAIVGIVPYFVGKFLIPSPHKRVGRVIFFVLGFASVATALLAVWLSPGIRTLFEKANFVVWIAQTVTTVLVAMMGGVMVLAWALLNKKYQEQAMLGGIQVDTIFSIIVVVEILGPILKPLAFIAFYSLILGESFTARTGLDYGALVLINALFATVNIPLNAFLLSLYCRHGHFLLSGATNHER